MIGDDTRLAIAEHQEKCWEHGPVKQLRDDVAALKSWVKAFGIVLLFLNAVNAGITVYKNFSSIYQVQSARAAILERNRR